MYDFIGDVHGHATRLAELLTKLGYQHKRGKFSHPKRKAVLLGDLIDRGPEVRETLFLVRDMVENGSAIALLGNHELNALKFHTFHPITGRPLRSHTTLHVAQHATTLQAFNNHGGEWRLWMDWLASLPFAFESSGVRAVHACWNGPALAVLGTLKFPLDSSTLVRLSDARTLEHIASRLVLAGPTLPLPESLSITRVRSNFKKSMRVKWWLCHIQKTYAALNWPQANGLPDVAVNDWPRRWHRFHLDRGYPAAEAPLFIGHYHQPLHVAPYLSAPNLACLDYSVIAGGPMVAYQWQGERQLKSSHFKTSN